jgi:amidohydrolase
MNPDNGLYDRILALVKEQKRRQITWRRHLHRYPERSFQEFETTRFLGNQLRTLGLKLLPLKMKTGLLAELSGKKPGATVAIRSDIDALPLIERTGLAYRSKNPGVMHACGHDLHMATALGAAAVLARLQDSFAGRVRFIFEPGEEQPPGGARPLIAAGALKEVGMIFGLHVNPELATGRISLRDGPVMASVYAFDIIIHGKGGHAGRPHLAVDAIAAAAEVVESIQKVVSREIDPVSPAVISFGRIEGGTARNIIADRVTIAGSARALSKEVTRRLPTLIRKTTAGVCRARGARFEITERGGYPVLENHPRANRLLARNWERLYPRHRIACMEPVLGAEDFSCYLQKVPGAFIWLGIKNAQVKSGRPWHANDFKVDDRAMSFGTALLAAAAIDYLNAARR